MMKNMLISLAVFFFGFFSCQPDDSDYKKTIQIPVNKSKDYQYSDFFEIDKVVPLETGKEAMLGNIEDVILGQDTIYIADREGQIHFFDYRGKFLDKLHPEGRGPGEFVTIDDMYKLKNFLVIADRGLGRMVFYEGKKFRKQYDVSFFIGDLLMHTATEYLSFYQGGGGANKKNRSKNQLYRVKHYKNGEIVHQALPVNSSFFGYSYGPSGLSTHFLKDSKNTYLFDIFVDDIYRVDSNFRLHKHFHLDFGKHAFHLDKKEDNFNQAGDKVNKSSEGIALLLTAFIRNKFMHFFFTVKGKDTPGPSIFNDAIPYDAIYDRRTGQTYVSKRKPQSLFFGLKYREFTFISFQGNYKGALISIPAMALVEQYEQHPKLLPEEMKKVARSIRITNNSVFVFLKYTGPPDEAE